MVDGMGILVYFFSFGEVVFLDHHTYGAESCCLGLEAGGRGTGVDGTGVWISILWILCFFWVKGPTGSERNSEQRSQWLIESGILQGILGCMVCR